MAKSKTELSTAGHDAKASSGERGDCLIVRLGANIQRLRKQQGFSRESLAERTAALATSGRGRAVSTRTILEIEFGKKDPKLSTVEAIAMALGHTIAVLVS
jgi:transcriptional regulator with XRE-family HTH domain